MQKFTVSAPGKIILHGEHSVVYGKKAIAASLNLRTFLTISSWESPNVRLSLPVIGEIREWKIDQLLQLKTQVQDDHSKPKELTTADHGTILHFLKGDGEIPSIADHISLAFIFLFKAILGDFDQGYGLNLILNSNLPLAAGLGSSASVAVCLSAALLKVAKIIGTKEGAVNNFSSEELELINKWAYITEKIFHGNPSGVDNSTCTYGGIILYSNGSLNQKQVNLPLRILVVNTMVPRMTKEVVARVRRKMEKDLIDINQALLTALGVSHPKLQDIVSTASEYGLRAKLTGAGGGGVAYVLLRPDTPADILDSAKSMLTQKGYQCWDVKIGGEGVQLDIETCHK